MKPRRPPTRAEKAALDRALDLAQLSLAYLEIFKVACRRKNPQQLRREVKRLRQVLRGERPAL